VLLVWMRDAPETHGHDLLTESRGQLLQPETKRSLI